MIPLGRPDLGQQEIEAIAGVLRSGMLVQGPRVAEFEACALKWLSPEHQAVAVSNGTAALHMALIALGIGPGDAVLVPTYSWPATANVVELVGATPLFVDIDPHTFCIDPAALEKTVKAGLQRFRDRLRAIMVVHAFGCMPDMDAVLRIATAAGLPVIEDAACAIGSTWSGQYAGTFGHLGCFSFHPRKIVTTGEGGLISTTDHELARILRALRNHGLAPDVVSPDFILPGFNYRMTDFQGAMGIEQLQRLPEMLHERRKLAELYDSLFSASPIKPQLAPAECNPNRQAYVVMIPEGASRTAVITALNQKGISSTLGTWHIPLIRFYREKYGFKPGDFPVSDSVFSHTLALPLYTGLKEEDVRFVADSLLACLL